MFKFTRLVTNYPLIWITVLFLQTIISRQPQQGRHRTVGSGQGRGGEAGRRQRSRGVPGAAQRRDSAAWRRHLTRRAPFWNKINKLNKFQNSFHSYQNYIFILVIINNFCTNHKDINLKYFIIYSWKFSIYIWYNLYVIYACKVFLWLKLLFIS